MKTTISKTLTALFAAASIVSCKCNDDRKPVTETNTSTTVVTETTTIDSSGQAAADANAAAARTAGAKSVSVKQASGTAVKSGKSKSNEDPDVLITRTKDGTDAENHDGNPYTKNDQTPQPTGPPIK
ncbi:hypothetical protein HYN48_01000 [Flavobacterium magnum]|uniref:Lipoprotein n=1 Tax=Flavobacterium magnum TaxID=2162713 RepID=A0A2S0RB29_9FLAO|nr:hypothetical protein [Flavobacterium magnum]AWA28779.1 hypothetical protein HYN48_01000 [Flavobacterium magnum]